MARIEIEPEHVPAALAGPARRWCNRCRGVNLWIALFCLILTAGIWSATLQRIDYERDEAIADAIKKESNLAIAFEEQTIRILKSAEGAALFVAREYATRRPGPERDKYITESLVEARYFDPSLFTVISVADERGKIVISSIAGSPSDSADRDHFQFHLDHRGDRLFIGKPVLGHRSGRWQIPLSRRIDNPDGTFGGVVVVSVAPGYFTGFYKKADLGEQGVVVLAGLDGIVRARRAGQASSFGEDIRGGHLLAQQAARPVGSFVAPSKLDGVERIYAYRTVADYPLVVAVEQSQAEELGAFTLHRRSYLLSASAASALVAIFAAGLVAGLRRRRQAFDSLAASEAKYRATFDQAAVGIMHTAPDGRFLQVNGALCRMLGYSERELLELHLRDITYAADMQGAANLARLLLDAQAAGPSPQLEKRYVRKDGSVFWALASVSLVRDAAAKPHHFVAMIQDIDAAKEEHERYRATFDQAGIGIAHSTPDGRFIRTNAKVSEILGYTRAELSTMSLSDIVPLEDLAKALSDRDRRPGARPSAVREIRFVRKDRSVGWASRTISAVRDAAGEPKYFISIVQDITERRSAELALAESRERFQQLVDHIPQAFWIAAAKRDEALYISPAFEHMFGRQFLSLQDAFAQVIEAVHPDDRERALGALRSMNGENPDLQIRILRPDGTMRWLRANGYPVRDAHGAMYRVAGTFEDITEQKQLQERLLHQTNYDSLTQLPNRTLMLDRLKHAIPQHQRGNQTFALMVIDVDRFKTVNDSLGHKTGDAVLREIAARLVGALRAEDTVARLGGDEYVVILNEVRNEIDVVNVAQKLMRAIAPAMQVEGRAIFCTASTGIALYPRDGADAGTLLKNAEAAMYDAKRAGRDAFRFYAAEMNATVANRLEFEGELRVALERGELELHYQPQFEAVPGGRVCGFEALLRWKHPRLGLLSPAAFLPLAEETGLIAPIGEWVIHEACRQSGEWMRQFDPKLRVAVNVSPRQFSQPGLVDSIAVALKSAGLPARNLEIELTESMVMQDVERSVRTLSEIKAMGVSIAMDDFGTGYSSLAYLKRFPIDVLKIDKSFVGEICGNPDDAALCSSIIAMAHALRLTVVAEGVETESQLGFLIQQSCDCAQGYLFSKPLETAAASELLRSGRKLEAPAALAGAPQRTLLLLDDEDNILAALRRLFRRDGYKVLAANNSRHAFELLAANRVGVIIADQRMPGMTGTEFLGRVKALYPETVRIVLSGYTDLQSVIDAVNEGSIYRFLTKPWDDQLLRAAIREAFTQRELTQEDVALNRRMREASMQLVDANERLREMVMSKTGGYPGDGGLAAGARSIDEAEPGGNLAQDALPSGQDFRHPPRVAPADTN